jgi:glutathione S-transferase
VSDGLPVLWQYSFSNYNEKVRWALDFKRIPHRRRSVVPGGFRGLWLSRGDRTLPAIDLDGRRIVDSTAIIAALEAREPDPPLYPADPEERRRALELEDYFDEHAGHDIRRVGFSELRENLDYGLDFMTTGQPRLRAKLAKMRLRIGFPVVWAYMNRRYGFTEEAVEQSRGALATALDRIESERAGGEFLVGERFTVADLTAAALLYPLVWPPEFPYDLPEPRRWEYLEPMRDHPALGWIREMWRRHRGTSATRLITSSPSPARP